MIRKKIQELPKLPGVYIFRNDKNVIIYIGKAKVLKNRVRSYFQKQATKDDKTRIMVKHIADLEWIVVRNEVEAFLTEANLIKEHRPYYNVLMKDDKTFPYIQITDEPFPQVKIIRTKTLPKDGAKYYGPYTDVRYLRKIMKATHDIFHLRTCLHIINEKTIQEKKVKVCLDFHIKRCDGPCEGLISTEDYRAMVNQIEQFLKGRNKSIREYLQNQMSNASTEMRFEDATRYRDQLIAVDHFTKYQKKVIADTTDRDIVTVSAENNYGVGVVLRIRNGLLIGREKFYLKIIDADENLENLSQFIVQYYTSTNDIPREILLEFQIDEISNYENWLTNIVGRKVQILIPERGEKKKLVQMSKRNSDLLLGEVRLRKVKRNEFIPKMVMQLQDDLGLSVPPRRIEGFDNSNIQGSYPVASMVCFIDGKPSKKEYRKFNIKTVSGVDDFESMTEVVYRRYKRVQEEKKPLPDLILIDGGKGQLSSAKKSLDELGLSHIIIVGLAKKLEEVFVPGVSEPQNIPKTSPGLFLLRKIRDEAHRFAITFHRQKRGKAMVKSVLENVNGMGQKRIDSIWKNYKSLDELKNDSAEEINLKTGIPIKVCENILKEL
ncbi:MAG: excinuclease ABC subunit C [Candidatus Marinimicrobia bacterium]|nr:excinuclease ABC subunit C [Candidatus Neomarinimicrobiota bacterium]MBL7022673.1 excinuclease ABC subunit C [Candidatus Neomarinimicrobiota bacterium]MBL7109933.1 excinuclease ABC subunit C [Candidatus Neomarinimicrobiota bacterium]